MSESNGALAKALLAAQKEMPAVEPDGVNPHFKSRFVTLGHLIAKVRPVLNKNGIVVSQFPSADEGGTPTLVTILMHESGESLQFDAPLFLPKNDPQGQGSAITYLRRYALASALGISDQEDDDGNAGSKEQESPNGSERITSDEVDAIYEHVKKSGKPADQIKMKFTALGVTERVTSVKQGLALLSPEQAIELSGWLAEKAAA